MFEVYDEYELVILTDIGPDNRSAVVIDNFYKNPDQIRSLCLSQPQINSSQDPALIAGLPGNRTYLETDNLTKHLKNIFFELCSSLPIWKNQFDKNAFENMWYNQNSAFICNIMNDKTILRHPRGMIPHQDYYKNENTIDQKTQFGCVIYLNTPDECKGGTNLYSYRGEMSTPVSDLYNLYQIDEENISDVELYQHIKSNLNNSGDWKVEQHFPMRYNRCILYESDVLHGPICELGMFSSYDRINQVMFM